ncbi:hypothetical protein [Nocardioides sp. B-3]|uniref:hypothetical protein n=1 Tax=Nocardioides sp. B-3 TaxID=2895565 RepID=UPI0021530A7B|nr:hypothetical protein [Nocardioides sp. B-3]UUZ61317.1 hypothetical protein LP418_12445 [Nocardioides sp. B-3]
MSWRGLVAVVTLLAAGIVGGFAIAEVLQSSPVTSGAPRPVTAESPSFPSNPREPLEADPPQEALRSNLPLRDVSVGTDNYKFVFPAPRGWSRLETSSNEVKYKKAGNPTNTYIMRVEQVVSQHEKIPDMVQERVDDLRRDEDRVRIPLGARTYDALEVSYVHDGYRRFALYTGSTSPVPTRAEAEIAVTGREVDLPGMRDLMTKIIRGIREG